MSYTNGRLQKGASTEGTIGIGVVCCPNCPGKHMVDGGYRLFSDSG